MNIETHSNERVEGPIDYPITDEGFKAAIKGHLVNLFIPILHTGKYPAL